jgi:hypothetical protein
MSDPDTYVCECGNTASSDGFYPCITVDKNGLEYGTPHEIEPTLDSDWDGLYACARCGKTDRIDAANEWTSSN